MKSILLRIHIDRDIYSENICNSGLKDTPYIFNENFLHTIISNESQK